MGSLKSWIVFQQHKCVITYEECQITWIAKSLLIAIFHLFWQRNVKKTSTRFWSDDWWCCGRWSSWHEWNAEAAVCADSLCDKSLHNSFTIWGLGSCKSGRCDEWWIGFRGWFNLSKFCRSSLVCSWAQFQACPCDKSQIAYLLLSGVPIRFLGLNWRVFCRFLRRTVWMDGSHGCSKFHLQQ